MEFDVIQGDIAQQSADVLVNAAGTSLRMGSGVAGALRRAGAESVVLPALGCGVAGFDIREGGRIIAEVVRDYEPGSLADVRLIGYSDEEYETLCDAAADARGGVDPA